MDHQENPIKNNLEELFKQLIPEEDAPEDMKKEIFQTLDTLNLIDDIADLFTGKLVSTELDFLDLLDDNDIVEEEPENE